MKFKDMPKLPIVLFALMLVVGGMLYPQLPARIPMHWGPSGQIDRWGAKSVLTVFFAPIMLAALYLLLWLVPYLDPQRANLLRSKQVYSIVIELLAGMMTVVFLGQLYASYYHSLPMSSIIEVATGLMFIVLGNYMGRVKRNWTMGVRYSWTLSDDVVWARTNRLAGWLFMGSGVLAVIGALLPPLVGLWLIVIPIFVVLPVTYVYSMRLYRQRHPGEMEPPRPVLDTNDPAEPPAPTLHSADPGETHVDVVCRECGAENAPGNTVCIRCGRELG